ncbi:hypothetical protein J437_LFUL015290 [Ladona fulva]|uniref:HAT C-terminal dimerisation domain-containing protein n=1 Tax=Ladona fulva TaxID=123851 RepID=A0A8K0P9E2_LADFU|nr:hypothetical protein J437_LFUL015290 [Ladona fulva]
MRNATFRRITEHLRRTTPRIRKLGRIKFLPGAIGELFCQPIHHEATETATAIARIISSEVENLELEILDLKNDIILQAHATDVDFWKLVEKDRFPPLRSVAYKIKSSFGSVYLCESLFSTMNIIKSKNRSSLTDSHLESCLRASAYVPNMQVLVGKIQCQKSHRTEDTRPCKQ